MDAVMIFCSIMIAVLSFSSYIQGNINEAIYLAIIAALGFQLVLIAILLEIRNKLLGKEKDGRK